MIFSISKGQDLVKERDRLYKRAVCEREQSKQFYDLGSIYYKDYLQESNKRFCMAEQINKNLQRMGYDENKYSAHDIQMIKLGIQQKFIALCLIAISIFIVWLENDATAGVIFVPLGFYLFFSKKCWLYYKRIKNDSSPEEEKECYNSYQSEERMYK